MALSPAGRNGWKADISAEAVRDDAKWIFCDVIRQIALGFGVYFDPMSTTNENWEPLEALSSTTSRE
jgi:hypothetical protein